MKTWAKVQVVDEASKELIVPALPATTRGGGGAADAGRAAVFGLGLGLGALGALFVARAFSR